MNDRHRRQPGLREPVLDERDIEATSQLLRHVLAELEQGLEEADAQTRRKASRLVAGLVDHWSRHRPSPAERMTLRIERSQHRLRIAASADERVMPSEDWEGVGEAVAFCVTDDWGIESQDRPGAWFHIRRIGALE